MWLGCRCIDRYWRHGLHTCRSHRKAQAAVHPVPLPLAPDWSTKPTNIQLSITSCHVRTYQWDRNHIRTSFYGLLMVCNLSIWNLHIKLHFSRRTFARSVNDLVHYLVFASGSDVGTHVWTLKCCIDSYNKSSSFIDCSWIFFCVWVSRM